jgi:hypothetical protein
MKENETQSSNDLISLSSLKNAFLDFFRIIFQGIDLLLYSIRRRIGLFILGILLGLAGALIYYYLQPRYYSSEMIVYHNDLSKRDYYEMINNLNKLAIDKSKDDFAKELDIHKSLAEKINWVEAEDMDGKPLMRDTSTKLGERFKIEVRLDAIIPMGEFQNALVNYLNNNSFLKKYKEGQRKVNLDKLDFINREQQRLDSLKLAYNQALLSSKMPSTFYNNGMNPADIYVQSNSLANQKESIMSWLNNQSVALVVVDGLKTPKASTVVSLKILLGLGLIGGVIIGIILCMLAAIRHEVQTVKR